MSLKNQIESQLHIPIRLKAGAPGSLNVILDGSVIFSKKETGRYPTAAEIVRSVQEKTAVTGAK